MGDTMDLSNLPKTHDFYNCSNEKALFFFKDETAGDRIVLTILMRPKSYAIITANQIKKWRQVSDSQPWISKNKGVHSGITQMLSPAMFLYSLTRQTKIQSQITKIASKNHNLSLQIIRKNTLNHHLTKHCLNECGLHVITYGADNVETCNCSSVLK